MSPVEEDGEQDLTRKQRREQARSQRKALEEAEAASTQRRKRLIQLGSVVGVVIVIVVVILVATGGGSSSSKVPTTPVEKNKSVVAVTSLISSIPQSATTLGDPKAPVTLQYFGDLECPICREFTLGALPGLIQKYVRTGKMKIEYRNLETATREPETFRKQQIAAMAAGKQDKAWDYIELFYHEQGQEDTGYVTEKYLQELAAQVPGLNLTTWTADRNDAEFATKVTTDAQAANNAGFDGTPSFLLGKTGEPLQKFEAPSLTDASAWEPAINKLL